MADHPNAELLREGYALFGKGDLAAAAEAWSDDIVWHVGGRNPLTGDYRGKQEVFGFFQKIAELGATFSLDVHDIVANDEHAVALVHLNLQRGDRAYSGPSVHVWHVSQGKATEFWGMIEDQAAVDALYA